MSPILLAEGGGLLHDLGINPVVLGTQVVIFVITFVLLSRILFGRALGNIRQREEEIRKAHEAIQHDRDEVARLMKEYEAHIAKAEKEAYGTTQNILKQAIAQAQASVARAQADARAEVERANADIQREKRDSLVQLRSEVTRLTLAAAEKVMETKLDPAVHGAAVQKFVQERS